MKRVGDESPSRTGTGSSSDQKPTELENEMNNNKKRMLFRPNKSWGQFKETDYKKYGSVAEEIKKINLRRMEIMNVVPSVHEAAVDEMKQHTTNAESEDMPVGKSNANNSTFVSDSRANNDLVTKSIPIIILDSDDEDVTSQSQTSAHRKPVLEPAEQLILSEVEIIDGGCPLKQNADPALHTHDKTLGTSDQGDDGDDNEKTQCYVKNEVDDESQRNSFLGEGSKSDENIASDDEEMSENGLDDLWKEWGLAIENSKEPADFDDSAHNNSSKEPTEDCEHSLILREDIGYVCRICGIIQKGIQDIFEFQYKIPRSTRTYKYESRSKGDKEPLEFISDSKELLGNKVVSGFSAHPRHAKQMRSHQVEGFNFLARNLISDRGCILAHAPGSGKTFMIISFIQSFMATYPDARPLIVLPKGILATWKNEFLKWQIEDIPLYDLYSAGADGRSQQLEVLRKWVKQRSILFLGYMQFSSIVSGVGNSETITLCQDILSKVPSLLILDEGHTPRNKDTAVVNSISRVQTHRKVVLSGTLYQNHVQEVFNILDLVHPKFLQSDAPKAVAKRIMSRVGGKRTNNGNSSFYDLVERTLQSEDLNIKLHVINDLREMTNNILHYYKGDFLDDLPGLEDFTVKLNQNVRQKNETKKLKRIASVFKRSSVGSAIYVHPDLKQYLEHVQGNGEKQASFDDTTIDGLIKEVDIKEGVKAMFFLNVLKLCQITDEKLLVFSQYLLPLKFLERLTCNVMNWSVGREIFMITGDSSAEMREMSMNRFNNSASAKVFFGSIKACGEGISLVGASRIIILDVHLNPSVSRQAIGRAFRPGQKKKVYVYRLIAAESPEEEDHNTCFRKELVSKMWFEWNEYSKLKDFELKQVDVEDCGDYILESPHIHGDVNALYKRLVEIIDGGCPLKQNADPALHSDDETLGNSDQGDDGDDNEKTQCYVKNEVEDESQRNSFLGEGSKSDENIASDDEEMSENGLDDMWKEWGLAIENSKEPADFDDSAHNNSSKEPTEDCEHSLILREDIGYVCRICGIIQKGIQDIFEFQYKIPRSTRTYKYESRSKGDKEPLEFISDSKELLGNKVVSGFSAHPRHAKQMRSHQVEGFNFLARNLISDRGCILAHAPGSGKTFMIISFIQSFMATYPDARPLIVLPKGILATWKNEFLKWQIEDIPLYDLYSAGADGRSQQLEVLRKWVKQRSILFLGYMQFSSIVSGVGNSETITLCQDILSKVPSLLILDEGHTPRNKDTAVVNSISRVQTHRKVVLSGTLYQNHVQEVFNILDLVHPKFLQSDAPKAVAKRIMSRVGGKRTNNGNSSFYDLVERTLQSEDLNIKLHVINDLREMTNTILHYYKGDFLDDLPGLEDFTVKLNQNVRQKNETKKLKRIASVFKRSSVGSAIYVHPDLKQYLEHVQGNGEKQASFDDTTVDGLIKEVDIKEGVKAMFFLNVLKLCQITDEKLLVFSQYLLPLKFLERLTCNVMNWSLGREIFMITGDSSAEMREMSMNQFNNSASAKVFFGSIKACGEGISLVGASRIIILDVHLNPSVSRQAIGRAFRPGQKKKVYVYRLIAAESPEEEDHNTCFRKELVSKMWFEWNEYSKLKDFELKQVDVEDCGDYILESPHIHGDVKALYKR